MKKFILFVSTIATLLFFSCAGSGSSASEDDIGYLSFGSPRAAGLAAFGLTSADLTDLTLKGTKDGNTKTLGTWASGTEIAGKRIAIQAGTWTFELSAKNSDDSFTAAKTVEIKAGQHNDVAFTMSFAGKDDTYTPQAGDYVLSDGFIIPGSHASDCADMIASKIEGIIFTSGSTIYEMKVPFTQDTFTNASQNKPAGWSFPNYSQWGSPNSSCFTMINPALLTINSALNSAGLGSQAFPTGQRYWSNYSSTSGSHWTINSSNGSTNASSDSDSQIYYVVYYKQYN